MNDVMEKINYIYEKLQDEKSRRVFKAKYNYILKNNKEEFLEWFLREEKIKCPELDCYEKDKDEIEYILFGAGQIGKITKRIIEATGRKVVAWCDNNKKLWGENIEGIKIISPAELVNNYKNCTVVITVAQNNILTIVQQIGMLGFPRTNIFIPNSGFIIGTAGKQYFDVFSAEDKEVFIDAGCWNGDTSIEFIKWCNGNFKKIFAFEPDEICWGLCEENFTKNKVKNLEFIKKGTWSRSDILHFSGLGRGSSKFDEKNINLEGNHVVAIDEIVKNEKITFIKLDVEGSEMQTLIGAAETIKKYKPKLAVSVYHNPYDLWELASYILELNPEYKIYLRHYSTCNYESILYAL